MRMRESEARTSSYLPPLMYCKMTLQRYTPFACVYATKSGIRNLNFRDACGMESIPLLVRRGGCAKRRRGGESQVLFIRCEPPPRPRFRSGTLLTRRGILSPETLD